jgi:hypothetical protein
VERELLSNAPMAQTTSAVKRGWLSFVRDEPGTRFLHHYQRSQRRRSTVQTVLHLGLGLVLTAAGVVLWVLPGPGWLLVILGMGMFAGESRIVARFLDRAELFLRSRARRLRNWWRRVSPA